MLGPGALLYIPAGWPHTTDTVHDNAEDSVHLTVGLDTHIWGLDFAAARKGALARASEADDLRVTALPAASHWRLMGVPPHLGFLRRHHGDDLDGGGGAVRAAERELLACVRVAEEARWEGEGDAALSARLGAADVLERLARHTQVGRVGV